MRFLRPFLELGSIPLLFVVGAILLNLTSNALYDSFKEKLGVPALIALVAVGLLVLFAAAYALARRVFRRRLVIADITPRRGLIVLVSQGRLSEIPAVAAIQYHAPALEHCWLVTSPKPEREPEARHPGEEQPASDAGGWLKRLFSRAHEAPPPDAEPIQSAWKNAQDLAAQHGDKMHMVEIIPEDPENIFREIDQVYARAQRLGLRAKEVVADFTGGTKMMTAGMVLACAPADRDIEYMKPRVFLPDGRAKPGAGAEPKRVDLNFFLQLRGGLE